MMMTPAGIIGGGIVCAVVLAVGVLMPPFMARPAPMGVITMHSGKARGVYQGLVLYASDHGGRLPMRLEELIPDWVGNDRRVLEGPPPARDPEFFRLACPGGDFDSMAAGEPVIVSKPFQNGRWLVVHADGSITVEKPAVSK